MSDLNAIRSDVLDAKRMLVDLRYNVNLLGSQVDVLGQQQQDTRDAIVALHAHFLRFAQQAERTANLQRAELAINTIKGDLEHQFGHHKVVRRTAVGMLQAFDLGLVGEEAVRNVGDQLMLQTPRYWLAPVLVALAAWAGDDPDLCVRAIEEAYRRSPHRTSLFMMLVLRRQERQASAVRWLRHYLDAQDPRALDREFAVILEAIAQGAFGPAGLKTVRGRLDTWRRLLLDDETARLAQVDRWRHEMQTHVRTDEIDAAFPRLAAVSPQWRQLRQALASAEAHQSIIDRYTAVLTARTTPSSRIEDAIDDILDQLADEYDHEELPLRRELAANEAIVRTGGDLEAAAESTGSESAGLADTRDYLTIQTESALDPDGIGVSVQSQRLALAFCHDWMGEAHAAFTRDYRLGVPKTVEMRLDLSDAVDLTGFRAPKWKGSFARPMAELERSLGDHWNRHAESYVESLGFRWGSALIAPALVLPLVLLVVSAIGDLGAGLLIAFLAGVAWLIALKGKADRAHADQEEARRQIAEAEQESLRALRGAGAELTDWTSRFSTADGRETQVKELIVSIATAGQPGSPHERRAVDHPTEEH